MIDRTEIKIEIEIGIVTGGTDHVAEIVESDHVLAPRIVEIERGVARPRKVVAPEEENLPYIGMCHRLVLNILLLCR